MEAWEGGSVNAKSAASWAVLFLVIVLDAVFAVFFSSIGWR